ncbi:MAG: Phospholipid ABC transporter permease protein MlaE [Cytophagales bacterium]|jgi:phospholipid/cholesterol/gamma-HCH transport system permease protein|nr:ABC transporter permease [Bacteroidota bacterium]MBS1981946.1 ABC transporter permease [Bacteroidota bacterium]WHZ09396.1 MAG: Phospholipid ABC transporter permease protein MlaE [Cytophagales bacterium]
MRGFGKYMIFLSSLFVRRESFSTYYKLVIDECIQIGVNSAFLFILVSTFIGAVTTVQTAFNMVNPLIPRFVISQVVREMTVLELAPTVMALIYAGKIGSSMAGGLGTMRITEQIDALEVMGINSSSYLVLPKIIASMMMYPMLVILSGVCSLIGGYLVGTFIHIVTPTEFVDGLRFNFNPTEISVALIKAVVFAFLISSISSFKGYFTKGGALEVGIATTEAVTTSVIAILLMDYFLVNIIL